MNRYLAGATAALVSIAIAACGLGKSESPRRRPASSRDQRGGLAIDWESISPPIAVYLGPDSIGVITDRDSVAPSEMSWRLPVLTGHFVPGRSSSVARDSRVVGQLSSPDPSGHRKIVLVEDTASGAASSGFPPVVPRGGNLFCTDVRQGVRPIGALCLTDDLKH